MCLANVGLGIKSCDQRSYVTYFEERCDTFSIETRHTPAVRELEVCSFETFTHPCSKSFRPERAHTAVHASSLPLDLARVLASTDFAICPQYTQSRVPEPKDQSIRSTKFPPSRLRKSLLYRYTKGALRGRSDDIHMLSSIQARSRGMGFSTTTSAQGTSGIPLGCRGGDGVLHITHKTRRKWDGLRRTLMVRSMG